MNKMYW